MEENRVKVTNCTKHAIGVRLINGIERNIPAGGYFKLPKEDIEYNMSIAPSLFAVPCQLRVEDEELNSLAGIDPSVENLTTDEAVIEKKLKGPAGAMKTWIEPITQKHMLEAIYQVAKRLDLSVSKMKILKEKMPEHYFLED